MPVTLVCQQCHQLFQRPPSQDHLKYCSRTCYYAATSHQQTFTCKYCGKVCSRHAADFKRPGHGQYCSKRCHALMKHPPCFPGVPYIEVFARFVDRHGPDECWPWIGSLTPKGYGCFYRPGAPTARQRKRCSAHVVAYEFVYGLPLPGFQINHTCDNRRCCNPSHLYAGTQQENMADMHRRGRSKHQGALGEHNSHAKLTDKDIKFIRNSSEYGTVLAQHYGVSAPTIWAIRKRKTWRHLK